MQPSSDKIDDESKKFLQDVKKGKPRKFVMIKEGVQIDKLYVFKKGPFDRYVRMAKQNGVRGEAFWGVVRGDGLDIRFELLRADGFEHPPGKAIRLKEFLKEETSFKFEPDYVIVDSLTSVEEAEDETNVTDDDGPKFIDLLKKILPHVKRALATPTSLSEELQSRVREAQDLGRQREFQQGLATLRIVGQLTKQALAESDAAPAVSGAAGEFQARVNELRSSAEEAEAEETSLASEINRRFQEAEAFAQRGQIERAKQALEPLERLIELALAETGRRLEWQERLAHVGSRVEELVRDGSQQARPMQAILDYAEAQAKRKQFVKALVALDRLRPLLTAAAEAR